MKPLLWLVSGGSALMLACLGAFLSMRLTQVPRPVLAPPPGGSVARTAVGSDSSIVLLEVLLADAPFRASRREAVQEYEPEMLSSPQGAQPTLPRFRPVLRVTGFAMAGSQSVVLIEGLPEPGGGVLLAEGDSARGIVLQRLDGRMATLRGFDTTWVLNLRPEVSP